MLKSVPVRSVSWLHLGVTTTLLSGVMAVLTDLLSANDGVYPKPFAMWTPLPGFEV